MLAAKMLMDVGYVMHLLLMQAYAGAFAVLIAVCGGLVQVLTPDRLMRRTLVYRNVIAVLLAALGCYGVAQQSTDLLPLAASTAARFIELQSRVQRIRIGLLFTILLWLIYSADRALYLMVIAQVSLFCSLSLAIYRHRRQPAAAPGEQAP